MCSVAHSSERSINVLYNRNQISVTTLLLWIQMWSICEPDADPPNTPFPVIEECKHKTREQTDDNSCSLVTSSPSNITCSVFDFFPSISLKFRHHSSEPDHHGSSEVINTDGTINKSVTITAVPSTEPYVCVASDIPGSDGQEKDTSIFLYAPLPPSTSTVIAISTEKNGVNNGTHIIGQ